MRYKEVYKIDDQTVVSNKTLPVGTEHVANTVNAAFETFFHIETKNDMEDTKQPK